VASIEENKMTVITVEEVNGIKAGSCPSWCAYPHRGYGEICMSETYLMPAMTPMVPGEPVSATLCAFEGETWIWLSRGEDHLVDVNLDDAEQFVCGLAGLVAAARRG
jgi:hypothetical protein